MKRNSQCSGFTLIELSIVLVIIGLIGGGILVGQDLIHAATIRAQITQFERYNTAYRTFQIKYNALPGDIGRFESVAQLGFAPRTSYAGRGDGNGLLEGSQFGGSLACGETVLFWNDLSTANLIEGAFKGQDGQSSAPSCTASSATLPTSQIVPMAKLGRGNYIMVYGVDGINYLHIVGSLTEGTGITNQGWMGWTAPFGVTPREAFAIDSKLDDGYPVTGRMQSVDQALANITAVGPGSVGTGWGFCGDNSTAPTVYNTNASGNLLVCSVRLGLN